MAWTIYNRGLFEMGNLAAASQDLRGIILAGSSIPAGLTNTASYDLNFLSEVLAVSGAVEAAASGYSRTNADLAGLALAEDDTTTDSAILTWTNPTWSSVAAGETWRAFVLFRWVSTDANSPAWGIDVFGTPLATNGSAMTYSGGSLAIQR